MTIKRDDGSWNVGNIAALIICLPVIGAIALFIVTQYQLPGRFDRMEDKVDEMIKQENRNAEDIHIIKQILHIDGNYAMMTNAFNVVGQSTYLKNN